MKGQWDFVPLKTEVSFLSGGTPKKDETSYWNGTIPWVSSGEMTQDFIHDTSNHVSDEGAKNGTKKVPANTVLVVVRGMSLAKEFRISLAKKEVTFNQDIKALAPSSQIDPLFLFYFLKSQKNRIRDSATEASHGTKKLEMHVLEQWPFPIIDIGVQRKISGIVAAYDDLIENNRRRIHLLERAARLLFREWFVYLKFPGHEKVRVRDGVPEGWEKRKIGSIAPLKYGKSLKQDDRNPGNFPVYGSAGVVDWHDKALVEGPGIIVGRKGNVGSVFWCETDFFPIDTTYYISKEESSLFLYYSLLTTPFISTDVAVPGLNRDFAHSRNILCPPPELEIKFEKIAIMIHHQIHNLTKYNEAARKARDLLLPRLMSGEIAV